jgi:signal transduction histidine kinase
VRERTSELSDALERLKESEAMLIQSEKMSSLGQMVAGIAHEVNTPLAYVKASLETVRARFAASGRLAEQTDALLELLSAESPDEAALAAQFAAVRGLVEAARSRQAGEEVAIALKDGLYGIGQIGEIVSNLRNFSRLDRSKVADFDLHEGIESTLRIAQHQLGGRTLRRELGDIPHVPCSPSQINQVLLNLVNNAAQATPEKGGVITLRSARRGADEVAIDVIDNGHGIPADVLPKIFDPFFTTKDVGKGTGLGLAICYKIVESHGGRLEVDSAPGKGTRFTMLLPVRAREPAAAAAWAGKG